MRLILTEKPSVGNAYAHALCMGERKEGYIENKHYIVTWCVGHLVELANAEVYDERYKKWNIADLPIIPDKWEYVVSADKNKQFSVVKKLMNDPRITEVIFATDAGREGELIARLVYHKAGCTKPIKRVWLSSMEIKAICTAFENPHDGSDYENLYHSALCRAQADWVVGVNGSRVFTKLYNKKLNVGRVQTPTLAMITERGDTIANFTKEKYFNVQLNNMGSYGNIGTRDRADNIVSDCNGNVAVVRSVKRERKFINPPKLHDLTSLQREANRLYGFTAQQTLDCAQSLYEQRIISYPRTDSAYLTDDMGDSVREIIGYVRKKIPCFIGFDYTPDVKRVLDSRKVTDHTGIIPTAELENFNLDKISTSEQKILFLISNRLLCATADKYEYEAVTAEIECGSHTFAAKVNEVSNSGWKGIDGLFRNAQKCDNDDNDSDDVPVTALELAEGQELTADCKVTEHWTSPPKAFTEDSLLSAMQNAGKEDVTEDVERQGLGTPATRASIIEKLIKSGFVQRSKKNLVATDLGIELVSLMPDCIKSAKMTADWENALSLIAKGEFSATYFMEQIAKLTNEIITDAKANVNPDLVAVSEKEVIGKCPRCKNGDVCETPKAFSCSCGFALWKNNKFFESAKKPFTKEIATALIANGKVDVSGLYSQKSGKTYSATVCLDDTGDKWVNFKLEFKKKK